MVKVSRRRVLRLVREALRELEYAQFDGCGDGWADFHVERARALLAEVIYLLSGGGGEAW